MEVCSNCSLTVNDAMQHYIGGGKWSCDRPSVVSAGEQRLINALGNENATGTVLHQLEEIRKLVTGPTDNRTLEKLLLSADVRESNLHQELAEAKTEVEFFKLKADEWERHYRQHMEGCHDASTQ